MTVRERSFGVHNDLMHSFYGHRWIVHSITKILVVTGRFYDKNWQSYDFSSLRVCRTQRSSSHITPRHREDTSFYQYDNHHELRRWRSWQQNNFWVSTCNVWVYCRVKVAKLWWVKDTFKVLCIPNFFYL